MVEFVELNVANFCVAFLDLVGQSVKLRKMPIFVPGNENRPEIEALLKETALAVYQVRWRFAKFFKESRRFANRFDSGTDPQFRSLLDSEYKVHSYGFADTVVVCASMGEWKLIHQPLMCIHIMLSTIGAVALDCLGKRMPLRGGAEIGFGAEFPNGEVYGAVAERAYVLESVKAMYPRVVVGETLVDYVTQMAEHGSKTPDDDLARRIAVQCLSLLTRDIDGHAVVDYLGRGFGASPERSLPVLKAYEFVVQEHRRLQLEGDDKLIPRYSSLRRYFDERLGPWGIKKAEGDG